VPDGRSGQGRDHPVAAVLGLAAAAVAAGMKGYTAIAGWVRDVPAPVLADLYMRAGARSPPGFPPLLLTLTLIICEPLGQLLHPLALGIVDGVAHHLGVDCATLDGRLECGAG